MGRNLPNTPPLEVVVAAAKNFGIGKENKLPWHLPGDMAHFRKLTKTCDSEGKCNAVIMGRNTWMSIPQKFRPLEGRVNIVLSRNPKVREVAQIPEEVRVATSMEDALGALADTSESESIEKVFVIGGSTVYEAAVNHDSCTKIHLTKVDKEMDCDVFFPKFEQLGFKQTQASDWHEENGIRYQFTVLERDFEAPALSVAIHLTFLLAVLIAAPHSTAPFSTQLMYILRLSQKSPKQRAHEEYQYLDAIRDIIENGVKRGDRTGTGTLSKFGLQMRYSLRDNVFPLLTTKRVFWRGLAEELLWFVSGDTNALSLRDKNIHIWDGNGSREYLDSIGLTDREEWDLGPVYGFQWRHFGAEYTNMHADYTGKGFDQLAECINKIKNNPNDRRIIMSAWNPSDLTKMALPPCHMFCQFYVAERRLSCQMYQRSGDMGLGVPFNIASYSLLTRMVAQVCDLEADEFIHVIGDAHVYMDHIEPLKEQLKREPRPFPKLYINPDKKDIDSFEMTDFKLEGYEPHKTIKMNMSV